LAVTQVGYTALTVARSSVIPVLVAVVAEVAVVAVEAFPPMLKFATGVVEVTTNGAVPVATVEVNCAPERFPEAATEVGVMAPRVKVMAGVVLAVATDPLTPLAVTTEAEVTVPPLPDAVKVPPLKVSPLPTVITSALPVLAVLRPTRELVAICCNLLRVTALLAIIVALPTEVTSPVIFALVVTVEAVVAVAAFPPMLKFATGVVEVTTNGAVPVATVEVNCAPERFPEAATEVGVIAPRVKVMAGVVLAVATDPLTPLAVTTEAVVTVPPLPEDVKTPPVLKFKPLPTVISDGTVAPAVGLPIKRLADTFCIFA